MRPFKAKVFIRSVNQIGMRKHLIVSVELVNLKRTSRRGACDRPVTS